MSNEKIKFRVGSDNVFADIGVPDAETALAKADQARRVVQAIRARGCTQPEAAALSGIAQPKVSGLLRDRLAGFSLERLMRFLPRLGEGVRIVVTDQSSGIGPTSGTGRRRRPPSRRAAA